MTILTCETKVNIWGYPNAWSLSFNKQMQQCEQKMVKLEIQGNEKHSYHLCIIPEGFFAADYWYETLDEAIKDAEELFGVTAKNWFKIEKNLDVS